MLSLSFQGLYRSINVVILNAFPPVLGGVVRSEINWAWVVAGEGVILGAVASCVHADYFCAPAHIYSVICPLAKNGYGQYLQSLIGRGIVK